jgi:hypothetical protein
VPASRNRSALLGESYPLRDGFRVRLRMARSSDAAPIRALLDRVDFGAGELELARLVQFDPRHRWVICAAALIDGAETLVGVGAIQLDVERPTEPETLVVTGEHAADIAELLAGALIDRAAHAAQARAA